MTRDDDVWAPPRDDLAAPARDPRPEHVVREERAAWLERRFPGGGSLLERTRRDDRRWAAGVVLAVALVAVAVVLTVNEPTDARRTTGWPSVLGIAVLVLWAVGAAVLGLATRHRPAVSEADREVLALLTPAEQRALVADLRAPEPSDPTNLDVVAAAWLAERGQVLWRDPSRLVFGCWLLTRGPVGGVAPIVVVVVGLVVRNLVLAVPRLLAAGAWVSRSG